MTTEQYINCFLFNLYSDFLLKDVVHVQGGTAIVKIFQFNRNYSYDVDLTIENSKSLEYLTKNSLRFLYCDGDTAHNRSSLYKDNRITFYDNKNEILHIDIYVVPSTICEYSIKEYSFKDKSVNVSVHSINDLFVEKLYCYLSVCHYV